MNAHESLAPILRVTADRRVAEINCGDGIVAAIAFYPPSSRQHLHSHTFSEVSFVLAGAVLERLEGVAHELHTGSVGHKPAGSRHEDLWGREGALIFSIKLPTSAPEVTAPEGWGLHGASKAVSALIKACLLAPTIGSRGEAVCDLLAISQRRQERSGSQTPSWVEAVRCRIDDAPDEAAIAKLAEEAGVDRTHLSREFHRCFGMPPSVYRRQVLAARAVQALSQQQQRFSAVAAHAGFSDQAHMNRTLQGQVGMSPGQLRRLFSNDITSIQYRSGTVG
jgi:AraC-like DNA-binding protein/quercetin dioxygenase-like cupin family protein